MNVTRLYVMPVIRALVFFAGCALLVMVAMMLPSFRDWAATWGAPTTAAGFSIAAVVGALAFWFGADGVLANLIGNR